MVKDRLRIYNLALLGLLSLGIGFLFLYGLWNFLGGLLGAVVFYILLKPAHRFLVYRRNFNSRVAALLLITLSIIVIIIPLAFLVVSIQDSISFFLNNGDFLPRAIDSLNRAFPGINFEVYLNNQFWNIDGTALKNLFFGTIGSLTSFLVNIFILFFTLYYLLVDKEIIREFKNLLPFEREDTERLSSELKNLTYSTIVTSALVSVLQGFLLGLGFFFLGIKGAIILGFVAAVLAFIPVVGTPFVWIPVGLIQLVNSDYVSALVILILGLIVSNIDNLVRPYLQKRIGRVHPLTTLIGVFLGISLFGIIGIIAGPLLMSYAIILFKMFRKQYLKVSTF